MITESIITLALLGLIFGISLAYASKKFHVKTNPKEGEVEEALPGLNCGACGQASCSAFSRALLTGDVTVTGCVAGGMKTSKELGKIMGVEVSETQQKVAKVFCKASTLDSKHKFEYQGLDNCLVANTVWGGGKECDYGCMGHGGCVTVCPFDAIHLNHKLSEVNKEDCTACAKCIVECPKDIIKLVPKNKHIHVLCSSHDDAKTTAQSCKLGCIACGICEKACPHDAIHVIDNLAVIDYDKCVECGICVAKCPRKIIIDERK